MKILRITAQGLPLFKEDLDVCFYTQQRVSEDDKNNLYNLIDNYYLHSACAFIGINASGKTSVLKVINLALNIIKNEPINHVEAKTILGGSEKATIRTYFYDNHSAKYFMPVYVLHTIVAAGVRTVLLKIGISSGILHFMIGFSVSVFVPIVIYIIAEKQWWLLFWFEPIKAMKLRNQKK